jgi:hypothetical protein
MIFHLQCHKSVTRRIQDCYISGFRVLHMCHKSVSIVFICFFSCEASAQRVDDAVFTYVCVCVCVCVRVCVCVCVCARV